MALNNKAFSLQQLHRFDEAVAIYDRVKAIDPGNAEPDWNLSLHSHADRQFRGRLGRARGALEDGRSAAPIRNSPSRDGSARRHRGQDHPDLRRRRIGRHDSVRALRARWWRRAARASSWWSMDPAVRCCRDCPASRNACAMSRPIDAAGIRHALPDVRPAAGVRNAARHDSVGDAVSAALRPRTACRPGRAPRSARSRQIARRPGLVRQSRAQQRSQPVDPAAHAVAASSTSMRPSSACRRIRGLTIGRRCWRAPTSST